MSGKQMDMAFVLKADVTSATAALTDVKAKMDGLRGAATAAGKGVDANAAAMGQATIAAKKLAAEGKNVEQTLLGMSKSKPLTLDASLGPGLQSAPRNLTAAMLQTTTAIQATQKAVTRAVVDMDGLGDSLLYSAQAAREQKQELEALRERYNPLYAASKQYERQLDSIAAAEKRGAISAREAAAARARAAQTMAPPTPNMGRGAGIPAFYTGNIAAQFNDIGVMMAAGQDPLQLALQQGTQISQVLNSVNGSGVDVLKTLGSGFMSMINPISLATIGIIGFGAAGVQAMTSLMPKTKPLATAMADLKDSVERLDNAAQRARGSAAQLQAEFGTADAQTRKWLEAMTELEDRQAKRDLSDSLKGLAKSVGVGLEEHSRMGVGKLRSIFEISRGDREGRAKVVGVEGAYAWAAQAQGLENQLRALTVLRERFVEAAALSGSNSSAEDAELRRIDELIEAVRKQNAVSENSAGATRAKQMVKELERRVELERAAAAYGQDSLAVLAIQARHQRELTAERLEEIGLTATSADAQRVMRVANDQIAAERRAANAEYRRDQADQLAAIRLQTSLIGKSTAEQHRLNAAAEAEIEMRKHGWVAVMAAGMRANAQIALDRARIDHEQAQARSSDALDIAAIRANDPVSRAAIEAQREYNRMIADGVAADQAAASAARVRAKTLAEVGANHRVQISAALAELDIRQRLNAQVAAGTITAQEANTALQQELTLRPLIIAAAKAEGAEKRDLLEVIAGLRTAYELVAIEERRTTTNAYLRGQAERTQSLRVEQALLGQNATVRARILALIEAEQQIRSQGLDAGGKVAQHIREQARANAELTRSIQTQAEAWGSVQRAAEDAIGTAVDGLTNGNLRDAASQIILSIRDTFSELAIKNPLRNRLLGTDYATFDDFGGWGGIWGRLTGKMPIDEAGVIGAGSKPVQAMQVQATQVSITAATLDLSGVGPLQNLLPPANQNGAPNGMAAAQLTNRSGVEAQIWNFFAGKGLAPHQVAAIVGHAKAESGLNPLAQGDRDKNGVAQAFGLFQWNDRKDKLFDFIGGKQNLGNIQKQLEFAWHELMTSENFAYRQLMAAPDVRSGVAGFMHFERPSGYSRNNPEGGMHFDKRLAGAAQALDRLGNSAQSTQANLDTFGQNAANIGTGLADIGAGIAGIIQSAGAQRGIGGTIGSTLLTGLGQMIGLPGFSAGGWTGAGKPSDVAGLVHAGEYVFDAATTRRIGVRNLEAIRSGAMRGYQEGGYVSAGRVRAAPQVGANQPAQGAASTPQPVEFRINVTGTGSAEIKEGVHAAIAQAFEAYDRQALPERVKMIVNDRWGA